MSAIEIPSEDSRVVASFVRLVDGARRTMRWVCTPSTTSPRAEFNDYSQSSAHRLSIIDPCLAETLDILWDPELVAAVDEGMAAIDAGDVVSLEAFRRMIEEQRR